MPAWIYRNKLETSYDDGEIRVLSRNFGAFSFNSASSHDSGRFEEDPNLFTVGVEQQEQNCKEPNWRAAEIKVIC